MSGSDLFGFVVSVLLIAYLTWAMLRGERL